MTSRFYLYFRILPHLITKQLFPMLKNVRNYSYETFAESRYVYRHNHDTGAMFLKITWIASRSEKGLQELKSSHLHNQKHELLPKRMLKMGT